jgi:hypothetical protein
VPDETALAHLMTRINRPSSSAWLDARRTCQLRHPTIFIH